jgi:hypothetical protein
VKTVINLRGPIKCWEIFEWPSNWRLLKKGSAPRVGQLETFCSLSSDTERLGVVRYAWFETRSGHWLSWLRYFMVFLRPSREMSGQYLDLVTTFSF